MKAWLFQRTKGKGNPWCVGWYSASGKRKEKQIGRKSNAETFRQQKEDELAKSLTGYVERKWRDFRREYEDNKLAGLSRNTQVIYGRALDHFEKECKPKIVGNVTSRSIDEYIARRRKMPGALPGSTASVVTINMELRTLKRVFNVAKKWKYLKEVPTIEFLREPKTLPTFISAEEFTRIYHACEVATLPNKIPMAYQPSDWWQAFLLFQFMTGMRVGEPLKLLREDVNVEAGYAITRAIDNKAKQEARIPLHPLLVAHLRRIPGFTPELFPWPQGRRTLWDEFRRIQKQADIRKICRKDHPHVEGCRFYGFHDLRRGFATQNADALSASQLQQMMRHSSYEVTKKYINMAEQLKLNTVTDRLAVPCLDKPKQQIDSRA